MRHVYPAVMSASVLAGETMPVSECDYSDGAESRDGDIETWSLTQLHRSDLKPHALGSKLKEPAALFKSIIEGNSITPASILRDRT